MKVKEIRAFRPPCDLSSEVVNVKAFMEQDLSGLMPYIKGALENVKYFSHGPFIKFVFQGHLVTIDHDCIAIAGFPDDHSARACAELLVALLKDIEARKDSITPDTTPFHPPAAMELFKLLPKKAGCGKCGYPTCMAFAVALTKEETMTERCPELAAQRNQESLRKLQDLLGG